MTEVATNYTRRDEIMRSLRENRNDYAEHLQRQMREFIAEEMSRLRAELMRNLPGMVREQCKRVIVRALAPAKPKRAKKRKAAR